MVQPYDVSAGQTPLLYLLSQKEGRNQAELAKAMGVKPSSLTSMLNRMEKVGLLKRCVSDTDQRAYNIYLTDKGKSVSKKLSAITRFINERTLAGFRGEEKLLLLRLLEHMMSNMRRQSAELSLAGADEPPDK
jgi:DNA-binding MarR family transcriptional regulator